jgi:hypothetical protein
MSFLLSLSEDNLAEIIPHIIRFEEKIESAAPIFETEGQKLEVIMRTLAKNRNEYAKTFREVEGLENWLTILKEKRIGKLWKTFNEQYSRQLSAKDIQMYINSEKEIYELNQIINEVAVIKQKYNELMEAFNILHWKTGNITSLRVAELQEILF